MTDNPTPADLYRQIRRRLEDLQRCGVGQLPGQPTDWLPPQTPAEPVRAESRPAAPPETSAPSPNPVEASRAAVGADRAGAAPEVAAAGPASRESGATSPAATGLPLETRPALATLPVLSDDQRKQALLTLAAEVVDCQRCQELVDNRTQTVFGVGPVHPRLCFLGEAPGADEDRQGEPFVGRAGQLLDKMIVAMGLARHDVYILNTIKCRPPLNRNPEPAELRQCRPYWERQLEILRPELICCLGGIAAKSLLETDWSVGRLRGTVHDYRGTKVVVTYHPAYLLRNEYAKRYAWEDLQRAMSELGLARPGR